PDPALLLKGQRYNNAAEAVSELDAGVSFTVPWVNPGKYSAGVREARANLAAAEQGLEREQKEALRLLRDQLAKIATFHHHVQLFGDKLVPQARQAFEATRLSYESGKATFLDWISAQRTLRDIEANRDENACANNGAVGHAVRAAFWGCLLLEKCRYGETRQHRLLDLHDAPVGAFEGPRQMSHLLHGPRAGA